jgi:hypothetical protein
MNHDKKTYTESRLKPPEPPKVETRVEGSGAVDTVREYRVVKSEFAVRKLDTTRTINGFPCTGYIATWTLVIEKVKTREQSTSIMTMNEWTTPLTDVLKQAEAQEAAYAQAYAAKLGLPMSAEKAQTMGMAYLATVGMTEAEMAERMKGFGAELAKIQGYPIVTEVKWQVQGDTSKSEEPEAPKSSSGMPSLGGMLGKALADKVMPKTSAADAGVVFSTYIEVKAVKVGETSDADYEVPKGYKKTN